MLKLFANQRKITAVLSRACLPAVASSSLRNTHNLKDCRRSMSDDCPSKSTQPAAGKLLEEDHYHVWSLISNQGDSFMKLVDIENSKLPGIRCVGNFDEMSTLVEVEDSSKPGTAMVSLRLTLNGDKNFYLSLRIDQTDDRIPDNCKYMVIAKKAVEGVKDSERFIHWRHGSYSMFQSVLLRKKKMYLGSSKDGSLHVINIRNKSHPDPRVLFLMHAAP